MGRTFTYFLEIGMSSNNPQTREWQALSNDHHLAPFSDFKQLKEKGPRIITNAKGVYLWDSEGNKILDGMAGLWCVAIGYGRDELADAAAKQMKQLPYYNLFFQTAHPPVLELAKAIADIAPAGMNHVFFTGSGSEGNDTMLRMVRHYWAIKGQPNKKNHHQPQEWLPRFHRGRRQPGRHDLYARAGRLADPGHRAYRPAVLVRRRRRHEP